MNQNDIRRGRQRFKKDSQYQDLLLRSWMKRLDSLYRMDRGMNLLVMKLGLIAKKTCLFVFLFVCLFVCLKESPAKKCEKCGAWSHTLFCKSGVRHFVRSLPSPLRQPLSPLPPFLLGFTEFFFGRKWFLLDLILLYCVLLDVYWDLLGFIWFHQVLLGFTGFYWVLLGFMGLYWVLLGFTWFHWVLLGFTGFYWVLLGFTRFYWILSIFLVATDFYSIWICFTAFYWICIGIYWVSLGFTGFYWVWLGLIRFYQVLPGFNGF